MELTTAEVNAINEAITDTTSDDVTNNPTALQELANSVETLIAAPCGLVITRSSLYNPAFLIAVPALYFANTGKYILHSNWWGKWTTGITALTVFLHIFEFDSIWWLKEVSLYTAFALSLVSWFIYYKDYYNVIKEN